MPKILIVDDEPAVRAFLHDALRRGTLRLLLFLLPVTACAEGARLVDMADLAAPSSRKSHQIRFSRAQLYHETYESGALVLPVAGVRLAPGGTVRAHLKPLDGRPHAVVLALTLGTSPSDYGKRQTYSVMLNGGELFQTSEWDSGGGLTRSALFEIPGLHRALDVEVAAGSASEAPVTLVALRWYDAPTPGLKGDASSSCRMGLALLTSKGYGYSLDVPTMREIVALQPHSRYLDPELALVYNFCERDRTENAKEIDRLAAMAEETGIPLRIAFQIHWGGIPRNVPDSAGGKYTDVQYQMIVFDSDDQTDDPGLAALLGDRNDVRFGLSVPNVWSDTPWLSFNNVLLNRFRKTRLNDVLSAWHAARARLRSSGKENLLPPQISTGEETVYWAKGVEDSKYTTLNKGKPRANLMADFNPSAVADALRDGVVLDPRDGLDRSERWWLHQNLAHWQQRLVDWMIDATPPDPVRVSQKGPEFATDLVRRNVFTEPYALPLYPMLDLTSVHPGLEAGYVRDGRSGGEYWSGAQMLLWLQKERERGRIALPNIECTVTDDAQLVACLRAAYAFGARFSTVYNWHPRPNTAELLKRFADSIDVPPAMAWLPSAASPARGDPAQAGSVARQPRIREYAAPDCGFGVNRIELFPAPGAELPSTVRITLRESGPAASSTASVVVSVAHRRAGTLAAYFPLLARQVPGRRYQLMVEESGGKGSAFATAADGVIAVRLTSDIMRERMRSLLIEDWQDVADLLASLRRRHAASIQSRFAIDGLKEAERLFTSGRISEAYRTGIRAEQIALPAAYDVASPGGRLSPYPIAVRCPDGPVRTTVVACDDRTGVIALRSPVAQTVIVRCGDRTSAVTLAAGEVKECTLSVGK